MATRTRGDGDNGTRDQGPPDDTEQRDERADRMRWFFRGRRDKNGEILKGVYARALEARLRAQREQISRDQPGVPPGGPGSVNWTPIGPSVISASGSPVSGRVTSIVVGPGGNRVYVGSDNGGVWGSPDGGSTWTPLDDYIVSPSGAVHMLADALAVGSLAVRFGLSVATDEIYVGTGGFEYFGIGIRHSIGGGAPGTWSLEATNLADTRINNITIDPSSPGVVLAATDKGLYQRPMAGSMASWNPVPSGEFTNSTGTVSSLIVAGSGVTRKYYAAFKNDRVYSSPDGNSATWTKLSGIPAGSNQITLAAAESDPKAVYAFTEDGTLHRLVAGTFQVVGGTPPAAILFPLSQGGFDLVVAVDPKDEKTVYLVGEYAPGASLALFKGTVSGGPGSYNFGFTNPANPGADPTYVGSGIHADGHALAFGLNALGTAHVSDNVWVGCDGGVYQSTSPSGGANGTFVPRNTGLAITETTYLAQRTDTDAVVFAGTQDNGTVRFIGEQAFAEPAGGDGGGVAVDPNNPYRVMRQYKNAILDASTDGGFGFANLNFPPKTAATPVQMDAATAESKNTNFYTTIATTPAGVSLTLAAFGTNRLWLTSDWGASWVTLPTGTNPYSLATPDAGQDVIDGQPVTAIAFASATQIYAATDQSLWRYDKVGPGWTKTVIDTSTLPNWRFITGLAVDNAAAGSFYVTMSSIELPHLYYYDGAAWWPAMPAAVIDAPAFAVALDPSVASAVYVGTDVGVWQGTRTGPTSWTWALFSQGLPESSVHDLKVHDKARLLRAATHGRGLWEVVLNGVASPDPDLYLRVDNCDTGRINGGSRNPWVEKLPDPTRQGFNVFHWMSPDIKVRRGSLAGLPPLSSPPDYLDFGFNVGDYVDSTTDIETADISGPNRIFVEVHNRSVTTPVPAAKVKVLLLLTDATVGLPTLPSDYASHINAGHTNPAWLAGTKWYFADPVAPYKMLPRDLDVRTPQVVEFDVNFSTAVPLPAGHDHVCAAAFVTTPGDPVTAVNPILDLATMQDKHIVHRNLHLVAAGAMPVAPGSQQYRQDPQAILLDFNNARDEDLVADIVFERATYPGHISVLLPKLPELSKPAAVLDGFTVVAHERGVISGLRSVLGEALENVAEALEGLGEVIEPRTDLAVDEPDEGTVSPEAKRMLMKIATLDRTRLYVADAVERPCFKGIRIPAGGAITAALILQAPVDARPGDRYAFHVIQQDRDGRVLGGSSYIFAVTKETPVRLRPRRARVAAVSGSSSGSRSSQ